GAGFIGSNTAAHYLARGANVTIFDNFKRYGTESNARWLQETYGANLTILRGDVRTPDAEFQRAVEESEVVFHLAAQVAVTTSVTDPATDFAINAMGTFNVLEAVRTSSARPIVIYASTNKVYGKMADVGVVDRGTRYEYDGLPFGADEDRPLDFYSPYGCSKGCGDQYVIDYARMYDLRTVAFRQSCIYGPRQFGLEDQGWVAWFSIRALQGKPVTIYGDGKQVRDVLHVEDLVAAYDLAITHIDKTAGRAYNIGGGPASTMSLLELIDLLEVRFGERLQYTHADWRPGDQKVFVADIRRAANEFKWAPAIVPAQGVGKLVEWLSDNRQLFEGLS
ncbi:MAG: NAD-dependent epimerase/dehydratase family protein, partial [bacterium]